MSRGQRAKIFGDRVAEPRAWNTTDIALRAVGGKIEGQYEINVALFSHDINIRFVVSQKGNGRYEGKIADVKMCL